MNSNGYSYETEILHDSFCLKQTNITYTQVGKTHYVRKYKGDTYEQYIISGVGAEGKAQEAFKKWVRLEVE